MANWFKREEEKDIPEELKGKSAKEIAEMLKAAEATKAEVATLKTANEQKDTQLAGLNSEVGQVKQKLQELEASRRQPQQQQQQEEPADWLTDPEKAATQRISAAVAPVAQVAMNSARITARLVAEQRLLSNDQLNGTMNARFFAAWSGEIDAIAKNTNPVQLSVPEGWLTIFDIVKGRHADELMDVEKRKKQYSFLESGRSSSVTTSNDNTNKPAKDQLTEQELKVCQNMKITPEKYLERKRAMTYVNA